MNIHVNKHTRLQLGEGTTVFGEYPLYLRPGSFTVTLLFHDAEAIRRVHSRLAHLLAEIDPEFIPTDALTGEMSTHSRRRKSTSSHLREVPK